MARLIIGSNNYQLGVPPTTMIEGSQPKWESEIWNFIKEWHDHSDYRTIKTSGSTGSPKEIQLSKKYMKASARRTLDYLQLNKRINAALVMPIKYVGAQMMVIRALSAEWDLHAFEPKAALFTDKVNQKINFIACTPHQFQQSFNSFEENLCDDATILLGGGPVNFDLDNFNLRTYRIFHSYGMTETASHVALKELHPLKENEYRGLDGITFSLGEHSNLIINDLFHPKKIIETQDIGEVSNNILFDWKGRLGNVINSGGIKIHPESLELKLKERISSPFFFSGVPDELLGQKLVLNIEGKEWSNSELLNLKEILTSMFEKNLIPKEIRFTRNFHRTETGKIIRH